MGIATLEDHSSWKLSTWLGGMLKGAKGKTVNDIFDEVGRDYESIGYEEYCGEMRDEIEEKGLETVKEENGPDYDKMIAMFGTYESYYRATIESYIPDILKERSLDQHREICDWNVGSKYFVSFMESKPDMIQTHKLAFPTMDFRRKISRYLSDEDEAGATIFVLNNRRDFCHYITDSVLSYHEEFIDSVLRLEEFDLKNMLHLRKRIKSEDNMIMETLWDMGFEFLDLTPGGFECTGTKFFMNTKYYVSNE
ncbi:hypothetical protein BKA69DRAFT_1128220 [Paraphysoderma sedebokerense]|nr:hypothetical protein BKA69DRAFT_1128220 [Paraphysoderma sedebokerense]